MSQTKPPPKPGEAGEKPGRLSPGLGAFLRGGRGDEKRETQPELPSAEAADGSRPDQRADRGAGNTDSETGPPSAARQLPDSTPRFPPSLVVPTLLLLFLAAPP